MSGGNRYPQRIEIGRAEVESIMRRGTGVALVLMIAISVIVGAAMLSLRESGKGITPNDEFFSVSLKGPQDIDIETYRLQIHGLVDEPDNYSYEDILSLPSTSVKATLKCVTGGTGTAIWVGVRVGDILNASGLEKGAREVVFRAPDGFSTSLELGDALREDTILAYQMNGEPLPREQGFPLRVVSPSQYGYKWAMWVTSIEVVDYDYQGFWETLGWDDGAYVSLDRDWWIHAIVMSIGLVVGIFASVSGFGGQGPLGRMTRSISPRFHIYTGYLFALIMIPVFIYWSLQTLAFRGDVFYSLHGAMGLGMVVLLLASLLTGRLAQRSRDGRGRKWHVLFSAAMIILLIVTVILGFTLAYR